LHYYILSQFNTTLAGIAGNGDSEAMGSFTSLAMLVLWPVAGQDVYLITLPYSPGARLRDKQNGKTANIRCIGFDSGYKNFYISECEIGWETITEKLSETSFG
jgi:putative alpha-1,2-mannosidase